MRICDPAFDAAVLVDDEETAVCRGHTVPGREYFEFVFRELGAVDGRSRPQDSAATPRVGAAKVDRVKD